jgi:L-cysteine desulfidase
MRKKIYIHKFQIILRRLPMTKILEILRSEVKPSLGCTGPISVALATASARKAVGGNPQRIKIILDKDTFKNSISVITPGTSFKGILEPAVLGAFYGKPEFGLELLKDAQNIDEGFIRKFAGENTDFEINTELNNVVLYIEAYVETEKGIGHALVEKVHDNVVIAEVVDRIGDCCKKGNTSDKEASDPNASDPIRNYSIEDFYNFSNNIEIEKISFLKDALELNKKLALAGLNEKMGARFGDGYKNIGGNEVYSKAKILAAAASDARMSGKNLPAMSCATSGNVGITASVPLITVADEYGKSEDELIRAVALSYLMTIYVKSHIGRLSAMCACAVAASIGIGAGTSYLLNKDLNKIEMTIKNIVGSIAGILCDGAKFGCALKLSMAAGVAIESALLANEGVCVPEGDGLVCAGGDDTIAMLGRIAKYGMRLTDAYLCEEIINR